MSASHPAIEDGRAFGQAMMPAIIRAASDWDERDRILWWCAFMAFIGGIATADIGRDALTAIAGIVNSGCAGMQHDHEQ